MVEPQADDCLALARSIISSSPRICLTGKRIRSRLLLAAARADRADHLRVGAFPYHAQRNSRRKAGADAQKNVKNGVSLQDIEVFRFFPGSARFLPGIPLSLVVQAREREKPMVDFFFGGTMFRFLMQRVFGTKNTSPRGQTVRLTLEGLETRYLPNAGPLFARFQSLGFDGQAQAGSTNLSFSDPSSGCQGEGQTQTLVAALTGRLS